MASMTYSMGCIVPVFSTCPARTSAIARIGAHRCCRTRNQSSLRRPVRSRFSYKTRWRMHSHRAPTASLAGHRGWHPKAIELILSAGRLLNVECRQLNISWRVFVTRWPGACETDDLVVALSNRHFAKAFANDAPSHARPVLGGIALNDFRWNMTCVRLEVRKIVHATDGIDVFQRCRAHDSCHGQMIRVGGRLEWLECQWWGVGFEYGKHPRRGS